MARWNHILMSVLLYSVECNNAYGYALTGNRLKSVTDAAGNVRQVWDATAGAVVQENHYYPYGSMFGESASVEHQIAMSRTADNPYCYGGKEWLTHGGLNHYDFAARLYDPSLGRFNRPDPLNGSYPHLSPYLYCAGNPINATDPTGMAVIFDKDGNFLDESIEGFTGDIFIYKGERIKFDDGTIYNFRRGNGYSFSDFTGAFLGEYLYTYEETNLTPSAQVSIWNNVIGHFEGMQVYDETFSMDRIAGGSLSALDDFDNNKTSWKTTLDPLSGLPIIRGTSKALSASSYDITVENLALSVVVHEWYTHGINKIGFGDGLHHQAYINVINFKSLWEKSTDNYKGFTVRSLKDYLKKEVTTSILNTSYKNLYLKYFNN